jgi:hypothetical protein
MDDDQAPMKLGDLIAHDDLLETYPWLSSQILNKWRIAGKLRVFHGARSKVMYPRQDVEEALNADLAREMPAKLTEKATVRPTKPIGSHTSQMFETDQIRERERERSFGWKASSLGNAH